MPIVTASTPGECIRRNVLGNDFAEFSCLYPALEPFYTDFEKNYDPGHTWLWMKDRPYVPLAAVSLYGIFIVLGRKYMKSKDPWKSRWALALWNFSLSLFSFIGMLRTIPNLLFNLSTLSLRDNLCLNPAETYGSGSTGLWVMLFILSKFPELIDTFFIVVNKKPLIFLHWYHHISVLLYCWHSYVTFSTSGIFFAVMNYTVHANMYFYYFLTAIKMKPKWWNPIYLTTFQISQMIVGVAITFISFYYYLTQEQCYIQKENNVAAFIMYGSYLFLFVQFFFTRYYKAKVTSRTPTKKKV